MAKTEKETAAWRAGDDPMMMETNRDMWELGFFILGGDKGAGLAGVTLFRWSLREALKTFMICLPSGVLLDWALPSCLPYFGLVFFLELESSRSSSSAFR